MPPGRRPTGRCAARVRTARFWWLALGYFCALYAWYAVQVHQTKYLVEIGFSPTLAAWALGIVSLAGIPGQIMLGHLSDRIGREWVWTAGSCGFAVCYLALLAMDQVPSLALLYLMVIAQGMLGYGITSVFGAIPAEIFQGRHYGSVFGTLMLSAIGGGAAGPFVTGVLHDATGNYRAAFGIGVGRQPAVGAGDLAGGAAAGARRGGAGASAGVKAAPAAVAVVTAGAAS